MNIVDYCIRQPVTVAVGIGLSLLAGVLAFTSVPVQMKPEVDSVVVSVSTNWEGASAEEIESDIIEEQEKVLGDISGLASMTSNSKAGQGTIRLEFLTGNDIDEAMTEVLQKLDEVPGYPPNVLRPVAEDIDPESVDYIAWIGLSSTDPDFDTTTLYDFMERRLKPRFDRIPGISQVGIRGARQSELQIRVDPRALANRGVTWQQFITSVQVSNVNFSAGLITEGKRDVRIRATGRFQSTEEVLNMIIRRDEAGPVYVRDVATVKSAFKEKTNWARARGHQMPFMNFQLRRGANLIGTMNEIQDIVADMNSPEGILPEHARSLGMNGTLELVQTYDSTAYVRDAIDLVQSNILVGGILATITLLLFLRSLRTIGIIAIAIPISVIGAIVVLVAMGRSVNIISLAGMAFAVGMVVDNAIVVIENIFRHLEMGKGPRRAASEGAKEVAGAVLASTVTTMVVFFPILLIQETAGQLFKDIAYAIMAAVGLSFIISLTVIPTAAARILSRGDSLHEEDTDSAKKSKKGSRWNPITWFRVTIDTLPDMVANLLGRINKSWFGRIAVVLLFTAGTLIGIKILIPPLDYLPRGNRNIVFGILIPPPGYNLDQLSKIGDRIEEKMEPAWAVVEDRFTVESVVRNGQPRDTTDRRELVPDSPGGEPTVMPPPLDNYFLVSFDGRMFHGAISDDKKRVSDAKQLMNYATGGHSAPDTIAFAFQMPLFRVGGNTGSAIKIDLMGRDLDEVTSASTSMMMALFGEFGPYTVNPDPANFSYPSTELRVVPLDKNLRKMGMTRTDAGLAAQASGDGILLFRQYEQDGELRDLKIISENASGENPIDALLNAPIATNTGEIVDLRTLADVERVEGPNEIRHVDRNRAVTLQLTPPEGMPLELAIDKVNELVSGLKKAGKIPPGVDVKLAGSAGKLNEIKAALLGDGSLMGTFTSSLVLAFLVVYLVMVVLFQSWTYPLVIMLSVPLATFGGFLGLALVHKWSLIDRYMPTQNLDMLSILGFIILAGVVVNNSILIVHQTLNFLKDPERDLETPNEAIVASVKSRVRPILMSALTSVGGMIPLVILPGSGSELYRGLGAVVVGGLLVSTIFTLVLTPCLLSIIFAFVDPKKKFENTEAEAKPTPVAA